MVPIGKNPTCNTSKGLSKYPTLKGMTLWFANYGDTQGAQGRVKAVRVDAVFPRKVVNLVFNILIF